MVHKSNQEIFGPSLWAFLYITALNYTPERESFYRTFYRELAPFTGTPAHPPRQSFRSRRALFRYWVGKHGMMGERAASRLFNFRGSKLRALCDTTSSPFLSGWYWDSDVLVGKEPFGSRRGFPPALFGPIAWQLLHLLSQDRSARAIRRMVRAVGCVLPCRACREAFVKNCKKVKVSGSGHSYVCRLHYEVNKDLGKEPLIREQSYPSKGEGYGYILLGFA